MSSARKRWAIEVGQRLRSEHVVAALNRLAARRGPPQYLFVDNGSAFSGQLLDLWAYQITPSHHESHRQQPGHQHAVGLGFGDRRGEWIARSRFRRQRDIRNRITGP